MSLLEGRRARYTDCFRGLQEGVIVDVQHDDNDDYRGWYLLILHADGKLAVVRCGDVTIVRERKHKPGTIS